MANDVDEIAKRATLLQEKCGIFACLANGNYPTSLDVAGIINLGLIGLQHRGQEAAGIVTSTTPDAELVAHRGTGLLSQIFNEAVIKNLKGNLGIGHTRYSTSGGIDLQLAQPYVVHTSYGTLSVAHNGELVNSKKLRKKILESGVGLSTGSDSELITQCLSLPSPNEYRLQSADIIQKNKLNKSESESMSALSVDDSETKRKTSQHNLTGDPDEEILSRLLHLMSLTPLSYSLILMYKSNIYCVRDPFGNRPLTVGMLIPTPAEGPRASSENLALEGWVVSSESCSFPSVCAKIYRDVEPGEILKISKNELPRTLTIVPRPNGAELSAFCIFEYVYFARPDSLLEGQMVYGVRMKCGKQLAIEAPVNLSSPEMAFKVIVSPVPESAIPAALGFTEHSGYPYVEAFSKNRYVGRTFIQPSTRLRRLGVAKKFGPLGENLDGKIIILIEDSIVRGTTIGQLIRLLKESGALEVHIRIASPPLHYPCYMGINIPTREELIANRLNNEQLAHSLGANSLIYLSLEGLKSSVQSGIREKQEEMNQKDNKSGHCVACLTGDYPVDLKF